MEKRKIFISCLHNPTIFWEQVVGWHPVPPTNVCLSTILAVKKAYRKAPLGVQPHQVCIPEKYICESFSIFRWIPFHVMWKGPTVLFLFIEDGLHRLPQPGILASGPRSGPISC